MIFTSNILQLQLFGLIDQRSQWTSFGTRNDFLEILLSRDLIKPSNKMFIGAVNCKELVIKDIKENKIPMIHY